MGFIGEIIIDIAYVPETIQAIFKGETNEQMMNLGKPMPDLSIDSADLSILNDYSLLYYHWPDQIILHDFSTGKPEKVYPVDLKMLQEDGKAISNELERQKNKMGIDLSHYPNVEWKEMKAAHAVLYQGDVIYNASEISNLYRMDETGKIVWKNTEGFFHHSIEVSDSLVYACGVDTASWYAHEYGFRDDALVIVNANTGELILNKSVAEILDSNGMLHELLTTYTTDPLHLNDVQPANYTTDYWQKGDVGLSIRNMSLFLIYRPSTDSIIWYNKSSTLSQHDFDFVGTDRIRVLDNNMPVLRWYKPPATAHEHFSRVYEYNFTDSSGRYYYENHFSTPSQGRTQLYANFNFVESTDENFFLIFDLEGNLVQKFFIPFSPGNYQSSLNAAWTRLYKRENAGYIELIAPQNQP